MVGPTPFGRALGHLAHDRQALEVRAKNRVLQARHHVIHDRPSRQERASRGVGPAPLSVKAAKRRLGAPELGRIADQLCDCER
ncbi:MAG: hypothetical protein C5B48_12260 [Candidatus Rokuibacteriota bacterium]|nr:MAG: hypothetical protein C5B48_12260 [Candidatus Rokubacteria bacterium]